jgi:hypothetical protein
LPQRSVVSVQVMTGQPEEGLFTGRQETLDDEDNFERDCQKRARIGGCRSNGAFGAFAVSRLSRKRFLLLQRLQQSGQTRGCSTLARFSRWLGARPRHLFLKFVAGFSEQRGSHSIVINRRPKRSTLSTCHLGNYPRAVAAPALVASKHRPRWTGRTRASFHRSSPAIEGNTRLNARHDP